MTVKSKSEIEDEGGASERVATDFWECTDVDGKKWWCSDSGEKCLPKPDISSDSSSSDFIQGSSGPDVSHTQMDVYNIKVGPGRYVPTMPIDQISRLSTPGVGNLAGGRQVPKALQWIQDNKHVRRAAIQTAKSNEMPLVDSLLTDPTRIASAAIAAAAEAREADAPEEVLAGLNQQIVKYRAGIERLKEFDYTLEAVKDMEGLRDRFEIEPVIVEALREAPDEPNREKLSQLLEIVRQPMSFGPGFPPGPKPLNPSSFAYGIGAPQTDPTAPNLAHTGGTGTASLFARWNWGCCGFVCVLCAEGGPIGCVACCVAGGLLC